MTMTSSVFEQPTETIEEQSSPYVPLRYTLMGSFLLLIISILIAMSVFNYINAKYDLENAYDLLKKQTENNILNAIRLVASGHNVLQNFLGKEMEEKFTPFLQAYEDAGRDPAKIDLKSLKKKLGGKMDLYIINANGVVEYTTYKEDLHLDFKEAAPQFYESIQDLLERGTFVNGTFATEARTGLLRKFAYMPTPDRKYLLEFGLISNEFSELIDELDLSRITSRLKTINPTLNDVRIFSQHGHPIGDKDRTAKVSEETIKTVKQVYETKMPVEIYDPIRKHTIRYIFLNLKPREHEGELRLDPSKVVELTYNSKLIDQGLDRIASFHTLISIIAIILSILFTFVISAWITYPIRRIVHSVNLIAQGDLEHPIEVRTNNELKLLKQSITIMVNNLLNYMKQVESQNNELKELDKLKDDFLSNTSHELRTPINGIIGIADSLVDGAAGPLSKKAVENLSMLVFSGRRLANLVNDILDFSKLKHKRLDLQVRPLEIKVLVDVVLVLSQPLIGKKEIQLFNKVEKEIIVDADENRVQQILHNLIGNAIKFTEFGQVEISASKFGEQLMIAVTDTGIGIPTEKLRNVFTPFEQIDGSVAREFGGTGLGLSISKQLVELHGGEIRIQSTEGRGTRVSFTLPLSKDTSAVYTTDANHLLDRLRETDISELTGRPSEKQTAQQPANFTHRAKSEESSEKEVEIFLDSETPKELHLSDEESRQAEEMFNVLVVDDDPINLQVLENQLSLANFAITRAYNGQEALEAVQKGRLFAIILLDVMMPKMSGFEVCRIIRETYPANQLPIIMLTAKNQVSDLVQGLQSGANDYLTKPFSKGELLARIKMHVQLSQINIAYSHFVPLEFLKLLEKESIVDVRLGDHVQKQMTVLFADIRSFTTLSESMSPKQNFDFINDYLRRVSPVIRNYKGFIDKYIGDAIMALFPESVDDAVYAAIEIIKQLNFFNRERSKTGQQPIKVGIGLHVGTLMLGTIGEEKRMEGTVISDAVNLASRLEGLTKMYGASVIVSGEIKRALRHPERYDFRFLGKVRVKGKKEPVDVFEVINAESAEIRENKIILSAEFNTAIEIYYRQEFANAAQLFEHILSIMPEDKAASFYLERCHIYLAEGLPEDWEGGEAMSEK